MTNTDTQTTKLPKGWIFTTLADITELITDGKHGDCKNDENSGYYFLSAKDVKDGKLNYSNARQILKRDFLEVHQRTNLEPGDVLITNSGTIGRVAVAKDSELTKKTTFQKSVAIIKPFKKYIGSLFLAYQLSSAIEVVKQLSKGTAQKNLLLKDLRSLVIALPPLAEQHRIVAKIEELFSDLEHSVAALETAQAQLKIYRQAVLKYAFEGKLTEQWRRNRDLTGFSNLSGLELLARIQAERAQNGKPTKSLPPLTEAELAELPGLPKGWVWICLSNVCDKIQDGTHFSPKTQYDSPGEGRYLYITAKNLSLDFAP